MMLAIQLLDGRKLRVEAGRCVFDALPNMVFVVHNAYDPRSGDIAEDEFSVTHYKTGVAIVAEVRGNADRALDAAIAKIDSMGVERIARVLANQPIVNREVE